ncbi:MAG: hypothetical protein QF375_05115 [Arenicellales bacterium]|jgi:hypothetical protein|nr:hypothetical protein [Arenicellales bacterium]|tara:strand:+ start:309 stop:557 length:249 start_codon:yes stop_codon:yes gene_type:complete
MSPAYAAEVTLSGACCFPIGSPPGKPFEVLVEAVNARGKGIVPIGLKGGAPAADPKVRASWLSLALLGALTWIKFARTGSCY